MLHKNISYQNTNIHYSIYGSGKLVMLLHGFAEDSSIFDTQVNFLKENYLVIVPDLPGIGKSEIFKKENVLLTDYAEILKAIVDEEKIISFTLFGHSMGGYITLAYANKYAETLNAFGLLHSSAYADDEEKIATRKKSISFIDQNGTAAFLKTTIPNLFYDLDKNKDAVKTLIEKGNSFAPEVLIQQYNAMIARPDTTSILKTFKHPILFIIGEHDKAIPCEQGLQQSHLPQIAYVHMLRSTGHMGMIEEPDMVNKYLGEFLLYVVR
ncbi:alpha/beta fold hydrolase [Ferruginibacter sp.]|uniref:alpha/beta fold hydrolase n=1 Tax=Ferruginibacter sp. TaxID=1940288 RepID=UPI00199687A0|nr:alpha/beta hydrolase [Ferruginibacter sp.]MBC7628610.1 alpha/beta hydrolase [Ferruginibacter sp.]